jgi:hypothetical protein
VVAAVTAVFGAFVVRRQLPPTPLADPAEVVEPAPADKLAA